MRHPHFLMQKKLEFFEIYCMSARTGGCLSQCGRFADKGGEGVNFS